MSAPERFAKRKALGLAGSSTALMDQPGEGPAPNLLALAVDHILEARARDRFAVRLHESKMVLLRTVAVPFGLGHIVSAYDRIGGAVNTVHNARNGVYATDDKAEAYGNRGEYKVAKRPCHETESYEAAKEAGQRAHREGTFVDPYTGKAIPASEPAPHTDHTVSSHEVFHDPGRVLVGLDTAELSTVPENLNSTHGSINTSKGNASTEDFLARLERIREKSQARVAVLEAKPERTESEEKELQSRKALLDVDPEKMRERHAVARERIDGDINRAWYTSMEFAGEVVGAVAQSAAVTGLMAAFGELLVEFLAAAYEEASDWYLNGAGGAPLLDDLKKRLQRIGDRLVAKKDAAWKAFKTGALAGVIAALISAVINMIKTTQKRVARMLREGAQALVRVVTLLVRPGEGMTTRESLYTATHLVMSTGLVVGGIVLEETLEKAIEVHLPALAMVAEPVAVVLAGVVAGLGVVLAASLLDRWDPYGVVEEQDLRHAVGELSAEVHDVWGVQSALAPG